MGRPKKPLQQRPNGIWCIQLWIDGKRRVKSLETRDPVKAAARAQQAMEELRKEAEAARGGSKWRADTPGVIYEIPGGQDIRSIEPTTYSRKVTIDGNTFYEDVERLQGPAQRVVTGQPRTQQDWDNAVARESTWGEVAEPDQILQIDWLELVREAEGVLKRKHKKTYSASWHRNVGIAIKQCPFTVQQASPETIRAWMQEMQRDGKSGLTINSKCSLLSGLVDTCIKSGLLAGHTNPFALVDYAAGEANHIPPATEADYRGLKELLPSLPKKQAIPILIQAFTGCRISEVRKRKQADFDLEAGTMEVVVGTAKNKASERVIPLPSQVVEMLRDFDFKWGSEAHINKRIQMVNSTLSSHSFRHGLTKLGRDLQANEIAIEALLGHRLSHSEMANRYGGKYGHEAMRKAVEPVWATLNEWVGAGTVEILKPPLDQAS